MEKSAIRENLETVVGKIESASSKRNPEFRDATHPKLMLATKSVRPREIIAAYEAGQRDFGENYVQQLAEKATDPGILENCREIRWHLIGHLQSNKINKLLSVPNLHQVQTVHSEKLATALDQKWPEFRPGHATRLKIMLQVNTGGEDSKSGMPPEEVTKTAKYVLEKCEHLELEGLMTIGRYGYNPEDGPNPDFLCLRRCRDEMCEELGLNWTDFELSMGMTSDFEQAIGLGSTLVRVGAAVFGRRIYGNPPGNMRND